MRKALILVGMFLISFTLVACGDDTTKVTPPTFNSINVDAYDGEQGTPLHAAAQAGLSEMVKFLVV